jgi:hypothetical protein
MSSDLTHGLHPSGSTAYGNLTCIAPSYNNLDVVYTGSDDGRVAVTFDAGNNWNFIDADLPNRYVTQIAIHPDDDLIAYATFSGYRTLDYTPHIYKTIDGGANWQDISGNLPSVPINDVVISTTNNQLYIATDTGVWYSNNDGISWDVVGNNLQIGIVTDIKVHEPTNTLYAGTFGRSMYSFDLNNIATGIDESAIKKEIIKVYPNPVVADISLEIDLKTTSNIIVLLTDFQGRMISKLYDGKNKSKKYIFHLNRKNIKKGIYFVRVQTENQQFVKKILLK